MTKQTRRDLLSTLGGLALTLPAGSSAAMASRLPRPLPRPATPVCRAGGADLGRLQAAMARGRFIAYHPTGISFWYGKAGHASEASIHADLKALRPWFDGLITYSAGHGAEHVADIAAKLGYRAVIQGVWDPADRHEVASALAAYKRHPKLVVGLSLGNEVVLSKRGTWGDLGYALRRVRRFAPGLPLTATEDFAEFLDDPDARSTLAAMDFMMVNIHPSSRAGSSTPSLSTGRSSWCGSRDLLAQEILRTQFWSRKPACRRGRRRRAIPARCSGPSIARWKRR